MSNGSHDSGSGVSPPPAQGSRPAGAPFLPPRAPASSGGGQRTTCPSWGSAQKAAGATTTGCLARSRSSESARPTREPDPVGVVASQAPPQTLRALPARCAAPVATLSKLGQDKCTVPCAYRTGGRASSPAPQARTNARTGQDGCGLACQHSPHQKSRRVSSNRRGLRWRGRPRGGRRIARRPRGGAGLRMRAEANRLEARHCISLEIARPECCGGSRSYGRCGSRASHLHRSAGARPLRRHRRWLAAQELRRLH